MTGLIERKVSRAELPQAVDELRDCLGCPVDEKIKPLVIGLVSAGVATIASCEGHMSHGCAYPWVDISIKDSGRIVELLKKFDFVSLLISDPPSKARWMVLPLGTETLRLCPEVRCQALSKLQLSARTFGEWLLMDASEN